MSPLRQIRTGYTLVEMMVASSLAIVALSVVASLAAWTYRDRAHHQARHIALEAAANVLEEARSLPWDKLTPAWAESKSLTEDRWLPEGKLTATVADEPGEKGLKRVVANVSWMASADRPRLDVELVGYFAADSKQKR